MIVCVGTTTIVPLPTYLESGAYLLAFVNLPVRLSVMRTDRISDISNVWNCLIATAMSNIRLSPKVPERLEITSNKLFESVESYSRTLRPRKWLIFVVVMSAALLMSANARTFRTVAKYVVLWELCNMNRSGALLLCASKSMVISPNCVDKSWWLAMKASEYAKTATVEESSHVITTEPGYVTVHCTARLEGFMQFGLFGLNCLSATCSSVAISNKMSRQISASQPNFIYIDRKGIEAASSGRSSSFRR